MNKSSHLFLTDIILHKNTTLNRMQKKMILIGSILPDIMIHTYIKGHTWKCRKHDIEKVIKKIEQAQNLSSVLLIQCGCMLHYIEDSFTFPHNTDYKGNLKEHVVYESRFYEYLLKIHHCLDEVQTLGLESGEELMHVLTEQHESYEKSVHNFASDTRYMAKVVANVIGYLGSIRNTYYVINEQEIQQDVMCLTSTYKV